jgi:potassium-transporting ATPase KdpC subunit
MIRELRIATVAAVVLTVVLGLAYPLAMTGAAQVLWPHKADGDPTLIAKDYSKDDSLFQSRPSATDYKADATFFNNQGPNQRALADQLEGYLEDYLKRERPYTRGLVAADVPPDAVTTSASGVDPAISYDNARIQANRVAAKRNLPLDRVLAMVDDATSRPLLGLGGPKSVNVVKLNDALEAQR